MTNKDDIAQAMYGVDYEKLSEWGKIAVDDHLADTRNDLARKHYGLPYSRLSSWGKSSVDYECGITTNLPEPVDDQEQEMSAVANQNAKLIEQIERLEEEIRSLEEENDELRNA